MKKSIPKWNQGFRNLNKTGNGQIGLPLVPLSVPQLQSYLWCSRILEGKNMKKVMANVKAKFVKPDGTLNGKIVSGAIGLVILFVQQLALCFGFRLHGDMNAIVGLINIVLTTLGFVGVMSDPTPVEIPVQGSAKKE